jgi:Uma2 family endonuclease
MMTLEEYLNYDDGTDNRYELVAGELVAMPPESRENARIAIRLLLALAQVVPEALICHKDTEIVISGARAMTRVPDLIVLTEELAEALQGATRSTITLDMPPPALVVEVVSPGKENSDRDYRYKRSEYAARGILEYWIVDPQLQKVTVLMLVEGLYEATEYTGNVPIKSQFETLRLTAEQVFNP